MPEVEATVERLKAAGAAGARMVGGGFGGSVLALLGPGAVRLRAPPAAPSSSPAGGSRLGSSLPQLLAQRPGEGPHQEEQADDEHPEARRRG